MKQQLRQSARTLSLALSAEAHKQASLSLCRQINNYLETISYQHIGVYMPLKDEPDIQPLYSSLENQGKCLYLPRVLGEEKIAFYPYRTQDILDESKYFALREPSLQLPHYAQALDVLLVPALHFYKGYRLGRGKGYYDRYLAHWRPKHLLGLSLAPLKASEAFDIAPWDIPMDKVFTPNNE